jgi:hypothetical protein
LRQNPWNSLQDSGTSGGSLNTFNYTAYLDFMRTHHHNFMRMWAFEVGENTSFYEPVPHARVASRQYDLHQFNQVYFDRLRSRVMAARDRGIYVSIMLFQGWSIYSHGYGNPWPRHPFNADNNINGIDGDRNGDGEGREVHSLKIPAVTNLQRAYIRKVIDTVNDLDNVLYEMTNESPIGSTDWQNQMIQYIRDYEATKPKQHLVGMTAFDGAPPGSMYTMLESKADWISPENDGSGDYSGDPPPGAGTKVIINDTDHLEYSDRYWVWKTFTRGLHPIFMDNLRADSTKESIRRNMGYTLRYANKMNLAAMTPQGNLSSTGYALANPGSEYLVYQPSGGPFHVNLQSATYQVEWFNPANGQVSPEGTVHARGPESFNPPFEGDAVLYLKGPREGIAVRSCPASSPCPSSAP